MFMHAGMQLQICVHTLFKYFAICSQSRWKQGLKWEFLLCCCLSIYIYIFFFSSSSLCQACRHRNGHRGRSLCVIYTYRYKLYLYIYIYISVCLFFKKHTACWARSHAKRHFWWMCAASCFSQLQRWIACAMRSFQDIFAIAACHTYINFLRFLVLATSVV